MAKKSSKASSPSWRTLMRQAKEAETLGHSRKAVSLRQEAAKLRPKRVAKAKPTSRKKTARRSKLKAAQISPVSATEGGVNRAGPSHWRSQPVVQTIAEMRADRAPGHGEIVGGAEHQFAEEIAKLARKKGGKDAIQNKITERIARARAEGQELARIDNRKSRLELSLAMDEKIVCAWLAEMASLEQFHREGIPQDSVIYIAPLTVVKIVDALNRSGYTAKGRDPHRGN